MTESPVQAAETSPPESALPPSDDAPSVLRRASGGRLAARMAIGAAVIGGLGAGGFYGYRAYEARSVRDAAMIKFEARSVIIGNDFRGREDYATALQERPAHEMKIRAFELDVTEVTVAHFAVCVGQGGCTEPVKSKTCNWGELDRDNHPINCVTQIQAEAFCAWAGKRLPREEEWEYAAGGGTAKEQGKDKRLFPWGDELPGNRHLNVCGHECTHDAETSRKAMRHVFEFDDHFKTTAPVGSFPSGNTPDGLKDMGGNVFEWTASPPCAYPVHDCESDERIIRGGAWTHRYLLTPEVTTREKFPRSEPSESIGFRCARDAE